MSNRPRPIRRMTLRSFALFITTTGALSLATADDRVTIKNNLLPGHFTEHRITRVVHRKIKKSGNKIEELVYRQTADWVQLNVHEPRPGGVRVFQMIVDGPAKVVSLFQGAERVTPTPSPAYFGLTSGSTRLYSLERGPQEAPALLPKCSPIEDAVAGLLADFAYWPKHALQPGEKWARDIRDSNFEGTQKFEFIELIRAKDETAAVLTMYVTGALQGALDKEYEFVKGQAIIHWARMDRTLLKLESRAEFRRKRAGGDENYVMELNIDAQRIRSYDAAALDDMVDQLIAFDKADRALREGDRAAARRVCTDYRRRWPDSVWLPAVTELERRMAPNEKAAGEMTRSELSRLLGESLIKWEAARRTRDYDILDQTRRLLVALTKNHGTKLRSLAKSGPSKQRAPAVFALAFSAGEDDFYAVQKYARDNSAAVRAMALAGMAARRDPQTSVELLLLVLDDAKANVRARACEAIAACVPREHHSIDRIAEKLGNLLLEDETRGVRLEAVRALAAVGARADVSKLEKALSRELDDEIRREIRKAVKSLKKRET